MKKRILHISKYYYPYAGGTEQIARDCINALKSEYDQKIIAFNDINRDALESVDGIDVVKCASFAKISSQSLSCTYKKKLHKIMEDYKPDIVVFHYPNPFVAAILLKELEKSKAKLVVYWHLDIIKQKVLRVFFKKQNAALLKRATKVIATSPNYIQGSEWLQSVKDKCVVIPNCINVERMSLKPEIIENAKVIRQKNEGKVICVAVGRHTEYKGFKYLIQASRLLDDKFVIYITGKGKLTEKLKQEALGDKKIIFTGKIDDIKLKSLIYASDIFCFSSITKNEAFGLALAEAMYYEKPAVTFTIPGSGVNYVCRNEKEGIEVENRNVEKYAEAMKLLAENSTLRETYGKAGRKRVNDMFLSTQFYDNVKKEFAEL